MTGRRRARRRWRRLGLVALLLVAALAAAAALDLRGDGGVWEVVGPRTLERTVDVVGVLEAVDSSDLSAPQLPEMWRFKISLMAPEGSRVEAGQPVLGFDDTELQQRLLQAIADRDTAAKTLEKRTTDLAVERERAVLTLAEAEANLRKARLKTDVPPEVTASIELRQAEVDRQIAEHEAEFRRESLASLERRVASELGALQRQLEYSESRVGGLRAAIERLQVKAPRAGTVVYQANWNGDKKKVGDTVWWAETIVQIPDLERLRARAEVEEIAAGAVALGQTVRFRLDAHPDRPFRARVATVQRAIQARSFRDRSKVMKLRLELEETDPVIMRPGMRFEGELVVERSVDVLAIPLAAIFDRQGRPAVWVDGALGRRTVEPTLGRRAGDLVEVVDGLADGDRVLIAPGRGAGGR
ncbi:MAG TPA: efflux RND transporter periplasmic adaptor subunit [Thermoanaerobaculia bacterium]|nr:efflux RND transporter periplasmic adaptor subunit [Thermoanaerobaculia bacterium]